MAALKPRTPLPGSERAPIPGARISGKVDLTETVHVTVILRPTPASSGKKAEVLKVEAFAREYGLSVAEESAVRRSVVLSGTVAQLSRAFGVTLRRYRHPKGIFRGRTGPIYLPA